MYWGAVQLLLRCGEFSSYSTVCSRMVDTLMCTRRIIANPAVTPTIEPISFEQPLACNNPLFVSYVHHVCQNLFPGCVVSSIYRFERAVTKNVCPGYIAFPFLSFLFLLFVFVPSLAAEKVPPIFNDGKYFLSRKTSTRMRPGDVEDYAGSQKRSSMTIVVSKLL